MLIKLLFTLLGAKILIRCENHFTVHKSLGVFTGESLSRIWASVINTMSNTITQKFNFLCIFSLYNTSRGEVKRQDAFRRKTRVKEKHLTCSVTVIIIVTFFVVDFCNTHCTYTMLLTNLHLCVFVFFVMQVNLVYRRLLLSADLSAGLNVTLNLD